MSTDLVQITPPATTALSAFGGSSVFEQGNSKLFALKPSNVELVQKTSRAEGAKEGEFRVSETGVHYESLHVVLMFDPMTKRSMYADKNNFGVPPICFSNNGEVPSDRAQSPQALSCARCRHSDWTKYQKSRNSEDLPKCGERFQMFLVDRGIKIPFKLSVRGKSISPMRAAMQEVRRQAEAYKAENGHWPNLHDFSFKVKSVRKTDSKGVYYVMAFSDIGLIAEEDRADFGALYQQFVAGFESYAAKEDAEAAEGDLDAAMTQGGGEAQPAKAYQQPKTTSNAEVSI